MNQILLAIAIFLTGAFAHAVTATTCTKRLHEYATIKATIIVDRNPETNARVMSSELYMNETSVAAAENNCTSRACTHVTLDTRYKLYPQFRKNSDVVVGVRMVGRSSVIVYDEYLGNCNAEDDEAG